MSHPHGCVSWNENNTGYINGWHVTPSRVCELKSPFPPPPVLKDIVTPSRVCELKCKNCVSAVITNKSHPHGCVSWNQRILQCRPSGKVTPSRVCELKWNRVCTQKNWYIVTPSRVCELKSKCDSYQNQQDQVTPSRVCELKWYIGTSVV